MEGMIDKRCKLCGDVIASRPEGIYSPRWNAVQYCPTCAAARRAAGKRRWEQENRHDCRRTNKCLKAERRLSERYIEELEKKINRLQEENMNLKYQQSVPASPARGGIFSALRRGQSGDKAGWRARKAGQMP